MAIGDDFLPELFRGTEGLIYFCALRNSKSKLPPGEVAHIVTRNINEIKRFRAKWDRPEHACGIYFHCATLKPDAARRIKENCHHFISLFSDTDDANHELSRDMARALLEQAEYPPTLIVDSGHGLQPYWLLTAPCNDADRIEQARKAIQSITGSDNVADSARVMRLVGSHNSKKGNGEWLEVEMVSHNPERRYRLDDLEHWLEQAPVIIPRKPEEQKPKPKHDGAARHSYNNVPDLDVVREALRFIPNDDREIWCNVGMALNDAFGDAGREVWTEWSASSAKYDTADQEKNWRSFTPGGGITVATVFYIAQQRGWQSNRGVEKKQQTADNKTAATEAAVEAISVENFYAYMPTHNYIYVPSREPWPAASVNARLEPMPVLDGNGEQRLDDKGKPETTSASKWLDQNRPVSQMTWAPGEPLIITNRLISHGGWIYRPGESVFNLYLPPTIIPGNAAQAEPWLDHIYKVYPDDAEHIIRYFAHRVQRPAEKLNHSLVLGGDQGIGKDTTLEPVKYAVGPWNFLEVTPIQILGRFNGFLKSTILRISEARDLGEYDRFALYDHMKSIIAAPPDVLRVDEKNLREHSIMNCCGVIITTNHRTDGIYLPADDRRHYVAWSSLKKTDFDESYWNRLWGWYLRQGLRHVTAYLLEFDLSAFNPKAPPPQTAAFWDIVTASRSPEDAELADVLDRLGNPDAVTLASVQAAAQGGFAEFLLDRKNRRIVGYRFEACGYIAVRNDAAKDGLWKIAGARQVVYAKNTLPLAEQMRAARKLQEQTA
jgi:hypothetical protein